MWTPLSVAVPTASAQGLNGLIDCVKIDPFAGAAKSLSFPNAVKKLIRGLRDLPANPVMVVAVSGGSLGEFAQNIGLLSDAVPIKEFQQIARRATAALNLETSKWELPETVIHSASIALNAMPTVQLIEAAELLQDAWQDAQDFLSSDPLANLTALVAEKSSYSTAVAAALSAAQAGLSGGVGWRFYAETGIEEALQIGHPDHDQVHTCMLAFSAPAEDLQFVAQLFAPEST